MCSAHAAATGTGIASRLAPGPRRYASSASPSRSVSAWPEIEAEMARYLDDLEALLADPVGPASYTAHAPVDQAPPRA